MEDKKLKIGFSLINDTMNVSFAAPKEKVEDINLNLSNVNKQMISLLGAKELANNILHQILLQIMIKYLKIEELQDKLVVTDPLLSFLRDNYTVPSELYFHEDELNSLSMFVEEFVNSKNV